MSNKLNSSEEYRRAVVALKQLLKKDGEEKVTEAFKEVTSEARRATFAKEFEVKVQPTFDPLPPHVCIQRLLGKRCKKDKCKLVTAVIPGSDHCSEWKKDGKTCMIVSQPYGLSYDSLKRTVIFCEENGLEASINAETAWYFPGKTLCIAYINADSNMKRLFRPEHSV